MAVSEVFQAARRVPVHFQGRGGALSTPSLDGTGP